MKAHSHPRMRRWMQLVGVIGLVTGAVVLYYVLSHTAPSAAVVSVIVLMVLGHVGLLAVLLGPLYALFRRRPRR